MGLLILLYPLAELLAWISFVQNFGFMDGVLWCLVSAVVGAVIMRLQGGAAFLEMQTAAAQGRLPARRVLHQLLMSFGGLLLILPGLWTDVIGALLVLPGSRHLLVWMIYKRTGGAMSQGMAGFSRTGSFGTFVFTQGFGRQSPSRDVTPEYGAPDVIDVKGVLVSESPSETKKAPDRG